MGQQPESQQQAKSDVKQLKNLFQLAEEKLNFSEEKLDKERTKYLVNSFYFVVKDFQEKFFIKNFLHDIYYTNSKVTTTLHVSPTYSSHSENGRYGSINEDDLDKLY